MTKPIWRSKSFWVGLAAAILPMLSSVQELLIDYPKTVSVLGVIIVALRWVTGQPVHLRKPAPASGPGTIAETIDTTEEPTE